MYTENGIFPACMLGKILTTAFYHSNVFVLDKVTVYAIYKLYTCAVLLHLRLMAQMPNISIKIFKNRLRELVL